MEDTEHRPSSNYRKFVQVLEDRLGLRPNWNEPLWKRSKTILEVVESLDKEVRACSEELGCDSGGDPSLPNLAGSIRYEVEKLLVRTNPDTIEAVLDGLGMPRFYLLPPETQRSIVFSLDGFGLDTHIFPDERRFRY